MKITLDSFRFVKVPGGTGLRCALNIIGIGTVDGCLITRTREGVMLFMTPRSYSRETHRAFSHVTLEPKIHRQILAIIEPKYGRYIRRVIQKGPKGVPAHAVDPQLGGDEVFEVSE